ncbi:MAG: cytochrome c3 family protein [Desulfobacterium sp.]|nr:cytochrome c3 family protein [Desulfobacterium sp.]MBU3948601.1 cytochrome c family protein [Pseudomonadota bacterium]MBU4011077.1 cytochrome c family protein [Pseudomonadota bacterium]MBU4036909.1 cytochrome c family protein [Pseudomonadota bacterium]
MIIVTLIVGIAALFLSASIFAGATIPDAMNLETKGYECQKGPVQFSHKKHSEEYKVACGDCHHDSKGKPLADLKATDKVQNCIECHKKPGAKPKGKDAPKLSEKEALEYNAEAFHKNCINCHKEFNKKNNTKAAPTTCTKCHAKK